MVVTTDLQAASTTFFGATGDALWNQIGGTFLAPGSTFSLAALLISAAIFMTVVAGRRGRPVRFAVLRRVMFPRRLLGSASGRADLVYFVGGVALSGVAIGWALVSADRVRAALGPWLGAPTPPWLPGWLAMAATTLIVFLAYELGYWLDYWLKHTVPALWHFHKFHHQAESLSLFTNGRVHPIDTIIFANIVAVTIGIAQAGTVKLLGAPGGSYTLGGTNLLVMISAIAITHLQHSHLWLDLGPFWSRLILGPAHHQVHHSRADEHFNRNLGSTLALFDRWFGTFHAPGPLRPADLRFGVDDDEPAPHGLRAALWQPFPDAAASVAGAPIAAVRRLVASRPAALDVPRPLRD